MDEIDRKIIDFIKSKGVCESGEIAKFLGVHRFGISKKLKNLERDRILSPIIYKGHTAWKMRAGERKCIVDNCGELEDPENKYEIIVKDPLDNDITLKIGGPLCEEHYKKIYKEKKKELKWEITYREFKIE